MDRLPGFGTPPGESLRYTPRSVSPSTEVLDAPDALPRPAVTYALAAAMLVVSVPSMFWLDVNGAFTGVGPIRYRWQILSSAFQHGWPGVPVLAHLAGNLFLISIVGPVAERAIGSFRFLLVTLGAIAAYSWARQSTGIEANGASVFIWAYAPIVYWSVRGANPSGGLYGRIRGALIIMWIIVPAAMTALTIRAVGPLLAFPVANVFHISATVTGLVGAFAWRDHARERIDDPPPALAGADLVAAIVAWLIPLSFSIIAVGIVFGIIIR